MHRIVIFARDGSHPHQTRHPPAARAIAAIRVQARIGEGVAAAAENAGDARRAQVLPREFVQIT